MLDRTTTTMSKCLFGVFLKQSVFVYAEMLGIDKTCVFAIFIFSSFVCLAQCQRGISHTVFHINSTWNCHLVDENVSSCKTYDGHEECIN